MTVGTCLRCARVVLVDDGQVKAHSNPYVTDRPALCPGTGARARGAL